MIKRFLPFLVLCLMLVSCSTVNLQTEDKPYLTKLVKEGDYVFTTTKDLIGLDKVKVERITACLDSDDSLLYGVIECDVSRAMFNSAMKLSGDFEKKITGNFTCWYDKTRKLELYCLCNKHVLFSNKNVKDVYEMLTEVNECALDSEQALRLLDAESAFYVKNPASLPDVGLTFPDFLLEKLDYVSVFINQNDCTAEFTMLTEENAKSLFTALKATFVARAILNGEKADLQAISALIKCEGTVITLNNLTFTDEYIYGLFDTYINKGK